MNPDPSNQEQAFLAEAAELLQTIEQNLIGLLDEKTIEKVHALMRSAHTIKGSAASVGQETIQTIAHHLEDVFQALYAPELEIDPELGALLLDAYECLRTPLSAALMGLSCNEAEILDRTASIFAQLQHKLGDFFGREALLPSSEELGFDVVESIFSGSVLQDLQQLETDIQSQDPQQIQTTLNSQAEFFAELAASYGLSGLEEIAQATLNALKAHPDKVLEIAQVALENFKAAQAAVLAGDRTQGGEISPQLREWAGITIPVPEPQEQPVAIAAQPTQTTTTENQPSPLLSASEAESIWSFFPKRTDNSVAKAPEVLAPISHSQDSVVVPSAIERILQSIWIGDPETSCRYSDSDRPASPPPAPSLQAQSSASLPSIRVAIEQLDRLSHTIGELLISENQQNLQSNHIHKAAQDTLLQFLYCQQQLSKVFTWSDRHLLLPERKQRQMHVSPRPVISATEAQSNFDALEMDNYSELHILLQNLTEDMVQLGERIEAVNGLVQQSRFSLGKRKQLLSGAQEDLLQARMVPLGTVLNRLPRLLQQMVATYHKPVELKLGGTKVLVDKAISEQLYDPLLHMIRNAFDHGIEPIETRRQQGKPETGTITIKAYHQGNRTTIEVRDDGRGLNWEAIRQRAREKHLLTPEEAAYASEDQLADLLFEPGFSTAKQVGELSGRGIGLDVVRTQLQALQGSIVVRSLSGQGTTFMLQLPLSLTTARLLVCQSQGITYGLLSEGVSQVLLPQPEQIQVQQSLHGQGSQKFWQWGEGQSLQLVPIRSLANLLDYKYPLFTQDHNLNLSPFPVKQRNTVEPLLLLETEHQYLCLQVDQILVEQELVIKSLGRVLTLPSYIQGYSVLGNGSLTLIVDPLELVRQTWETDMIPTSPTSIATKLLPAPEPVLTLEGQQSQLTIMQPQQQPMEVNTAVAQPNRLMVLVVEDSVVQRQSLVQTLQKADYQVLQAADGREAIAQILQHGDVDLVICDIEMPQMNGFEFLEHRRQDERLSGIPVVMLTTRSGQKHRQLALALGAKAYMTKPYSEQNFLTAIAELVNT
ncbi:hybrid sensor histidine kinase/response regulator [Nostoc sp. 'Peltigera membranacea cyanobiont' 210A]|uniref:hybrid sensor histidine kinase/response regulator n=1 Tax=Nostoc sp. 'Peltigera membranacea cyanobiont' 210A TaxID=2014529 RepID=UPI000B959F75|nr:hybrid sensor histidine kinase/response regulator [Nostoc sp. 'Peltigera membranacea cyanobiont' 210A]OYD90388.1 hybrid sensor histidine kinase/response regulator [Nostoc sp. 'Peltigera membranacea cyanobiont' 210A]